MTHKLWLKFLTHFSTVTLIIFFPNQHFVVYLAARAWKALWIVALENHSWPDLSQLDPTMSQKLSHRLQSVISKLMLPKTPGLTSLFVKLTMSTRLAVSSIDKNRIAKNQIQSFSFFCYFWYQKKVCLGWIPSFFRICELETPTHISATHAISKIEQKSQNRILREVD